MNCWKRFVSSSCSPNNKDKSGTFPWCLPVELDYILAKVDWKERGRTRGTWLLRAPALTTINTHNQHTYTQLKMVKINYLKIMLWSDESQLSGGWDIGTQQPGQLVFSGRRKLKSRDKSRELGRRQWAGQEQSRAAAHHADVGCWAKEERCVWEGVNAHLLDSGSILFSICDPGRVSLLEFLCLMLLTPWASGCHFWVFL